MLFISFLKLFLFSKYLNFCLDKDKKDKVNFEIYDVTASLTSNYNTHIAQYLPN